MNNTEKKMADMKAFVVSAGCMTIEHISSAIRRSRKAITEDYIRKTVKDLQYYVNLMVEDFNLNFPEGGKHDGDKTR